MKKLTIWNDNDWHPNEDLYTWHVKRKQHDLNLNQTKKDSKLTKITWLS